MAETILVVDHEECLRELIHSILASANYQCLEASGGHEALAVLDSGQKVDLVLSKLVTYPMSRVELAGIELLRLVRKRYPELPVVLFNAAWESWVMEMAMREGAADYLDCPFRSEELLETVRMALEKRGPRPETRRRLTNVAKRV